MKMIFRAPFASRGSRQLIYTLSFLVHDACGVWSNGCIRSSWRRRCTSACRWSTVYSSIWREF